MKTPSTPAAPAARAGTVLARTTRMWLPVLALLMSQAALADIEVSAPDGRRVLLKDDGTWRYQDAKDKAVAPATAKKEGEVVLSLERAIERGNHCRLVFRLVNNLPHAIGNIVPYVSAYRASGTMHETLSMAFQSIRPTDTMTQSVDFSRITCAEIARVQVTGGDRCEIGELYKFSDAKGQCLALVRVVPSNLTRFEK